MGDGRKKEPKGRSRNLPCPNHPTVKAKNCKPCLPKTRHELRLEEQARWDSLTPEQKAEEIREARRARQRALSVLALVDMISM